MPEKKILITGATGFIGAYLLHYLVSKDEKNIRALRRQSSPLDLVESIYNQVEWVEGDILDPTSLEDAMQGIDKIYHCAAIVSFNQNDAAYMMRVNQEGTANVVNIALEKKVEKLVYVSSIAAIGRRKNETTINEKSKWSSDKSNTPYGISKHLAEMEVYRGMAEGLNAAIVNPSNVLGSGFWKGRATTGQFFFKMWRGLPFYPAGGTGFVDVRDVVRFMHLLMESDITSERYILNGDNLPFLTIFENIAKSLSVRIPFIKVSPLIREVAWRSSWLLSKFTGKPPFITKQTARYSARNYFYENGKSLEQFSFLYTPIEQTIKETGNQFLESVTKGLKPMILPF